MRIQYEDLGEAERQYLEALDVAHEEILLIRGHRGIADDQPYQEKQNVSVKDIPTKVTVISPHSSAWTVELEPVQGSSTARFSYDPDTDQVTLDLPGQTPEVLTRDVMGMGTLNSLHEHLFEFRDGLA